MDKHTGNTLCTKCGKPFVYVGDVFDGNPKPYCTCGENNANPLPDFSYNPVVEVKWKYCPHCGKELK